MPLPMKAMKAMKVMKQAMKKKPPLNKGAMKKTKPLNKGATKKTQPLNKGALAKLGSLSLNEKMKKIAESQEDEVEAAMVLKEEMTPSEKVKAWNRYDAHLKKKEMKKKERSSRTAPRMRKASKPLCF